MPKIIYGLMSTDLIVDRESNSTSFIRTVEHAVVREFPSVLPPIYFGSLWDLEGDGDEPFTVSLSLTPPEGEPITLGVQEVPPAKTMLHKMNFQLPGLQVQGEGRHVVSAAIKNGETWTTVVELPLFVFQAGKS
eukprot:TRINITY_DN19077_c0_g1_i1.p3 TRINITY_DN19077_c0_g1~~TRINITY_DN19077_c0_g1_i1.p3  ORF type:complete len:134 (-),score=60.59 TRINITY_DN19077_c0_g1_i1:88-489(-)